MDIAGFSVAETSIPRISSSDLVHLPLKVPLSLPQAGLSPGRGGALHLPAISCGDASGAEVIMPLLPIFTLALLAAVDLGQTVAAPE